MGIVSKVARSLAKKVTKKTLARKTKLDKAVEFAKKTGFLGRHNEPRLRQIISNNKLVDILNDPAERKKITAIPKWSGKPKKKSVPKKKGTNVDLATFKKVMASKMKPTRTTAKEKATRVKKKSDKRIEGSGAHSARPPGSLGKTKTADRPRGSASKSGMGTALMSAARKRVKSKNYNTAMAKYDEIPARIRGSISAAIKLGKRSIAKKLLEDYRLSVDQFKEVLDKLKK